MASIKKRLLANGEPRWDIRYREPGGRPVERTAKTWDEARAIRREVETSEAAGTLVSRRAGELTLSDYAGGWIDTRLVKGRPLSPATRQGYRALLRRNIDPTLGAVPLRKITAEAVRSWYSELLQAAGRDQAAKSYRLLRAVLNTAVEDMRIPRNPCRIRGAGIENAGERPIVSAAVVLELAEAIAPRLRALVILAGFGGLRTGELLSLTRADVDLVHRTVRVRSSASEIAGAGRVVGSPKSEAGVRTVALPRVAVEALDEHLARYAQPGPSGVMFTGPRGRPLRRADLSIEWRKALAKVPGAPGGMHVHDLRHHAATLMARMPGVTTKELMARIGHSSPRAALIYQHATAERDRAIADFLDQQIAAAAAATAEPVAPIVDLGGRSR